jgi:hypothetical protein
MCVHLIMRFRVSVAFACAVLAFVAAPAAAHAAYFHIVNKETNWCLDANEAGDVSIGACQPNGTTQLWERWNGGWTRNVGTGLCLVGAGQYSPESIHASPCAWNEPRMNWLHWYGGWYERATFDSGGVNWPPECLSRVGHTDDVTGIVCTNPNGPNPPAEEWYAVEATLAAPPAPPPPPVDPCTPVSTTGGVTLQVGFAHSKRIATARYGRRMTVRGRLLAADGAPVGGASFCIGVQVGTSVKAVATAKTDAQGRFSYVLGPGASRRVWFVHMGEGESASAMVVLRVRAPVSLRARPRSLRNGQAVTLRGRLGGQAPAHSLLVELQARRDRSWVTFGISRTGGGGRFRFAYRFTRTFGVHTYRIRARITAQADSPFYTGASRTVSVRVAG